MVNVQANRGRIRQEVVSVHFNLKRRFRLTPGFSPVWNKVECVSRFNGFSPHGRAAETAVDAHVSERRLKSGGNERTVTDSD